MPSGPRNTTVSGIRTLADYMSKTNGVPHRVTRQVMAGLSVFVENELAKGYSVSIPGLGVLFLRPRKGRTISVKKALHGMSFTIKQPATNHIKLNVSGPLQKRVRARHESKP